MIGKMKNTTVCYIEKDGKYLMIHRIKKENDENRDKWIGIGGKLEEGESPFNCIRREVLEETGLTISCPKYRGIITFVSNEFGTQYMHLFTADNFTGVLNDNCDEGELAWIEKDRLLNMPIWEGDKIFLELLKNNAPFFSLKCVYEYNNLIDYELEYAT